MDTNIEKYRNYCIVHGKVYYTGAVFRFKDYPHDREETFICYDTERNQAIFKGKFGCGRQCYLGYMLEMDFVTPTDKTNNNVRMPHLVKVKESYIDGMTIGWMWYIFLMIISILFKDAIGLWIFISYVFFSWRHKKIEKEGYHIEW